jgi:hypothetical protein
MPPRRIRRIPASLTTVAVGHIPGTLRRDLPRTDENHRDLSRRSDEVPAAFAMVRDTPAQDPAYRPAHPFLSA